MLLFTNSLLITLNCTIFPFTGQCGNCTDPQVYDPVAKKCGCPQNFFESPTVPGSCTPCDPGKNSPGSASFCLKTIEVLASAAGQTIPNIPCAPGLSVFLDPVTQQYACVSDVRIDHNITYEVTDAAGAVICGTGLSFDAYYGSCYSLDNYQPPVQGNQSDTAYKLVLQLHKAFAVCASGSPRGCLSLYNRCVQANDLSSVACVKHSSLATKLKADIYKNLNINATALPSLTLGLNQSTALTYDVQKNATPQLRTHVSDVDGNVIYNGPAFMGSFSLCSFIRSQQTHEQQYLFKTVNRPQMSRRTSYGFTNRILHSFYFQQDERNFDTDQMPFFAKMVNYQERCGFGRLSSAVFVEFSALTTAGELFRIPVYANATDSDYNTSRATSPGLVFGSYADGTYLQKIKFIFPVDSTKKTVLGPFIVATKANLSAAASNYFVEDLSQLTARPRPQTQPNSHQLDIIFSIGSTVSSPIVFIIICAVIGFASSILRCCALTGQYPCPQKCIVERMVVKKNAEGNDEELQKQNWWPVLSFALYIIGYAGAGYVAFAILQGVNILERSPKSETPVNQMQFDGWIVFGAIAYVAFFAARIWERAYAPVLIVDKGARETFKRIFLVNKVQELQKERPSKLTFSYVVSIIIFILMDVIYLGTPGNDWNIYPTSIEYEATTITFIVIFVITYFVMMILKLVYNWFYPSRFAKFQELLVALNADIIIRETRRTFVVLKGGGLQQSIDAATVTNSLQKQSEHFTPEQKHAYKIYFGDTDDAYLNIVKMMDVLRFYAAQKPKTLFNKSVQFNEKAKESHQTLMQLSQLIIDEATGENLPQCYQLLYFDLRTGSGKQIRMFEIPFSTQDIVKRNPVYKQGMMYGMWFYELIFVLISILISSYIVQNTTVGVIIGFVCLQLLRWVQNRLVKRSLSKTNLVGEEFAGFFQ